MKTINVSDKAAEIIERLRKENEYFQTKNFICDAIESAVCHASEGLSDVEIIINQLTDYSILCRFLNDVFDIEK